MRDESSRASGAQARVRNAQASAPRAANAGTRSWPAEDGRDEVEAAVEPLVPVPELELEPPCEPPPAWLVVVAAEDEMVPTMLGVPLL